jgi:hypothetical protein
MNTPVNFEIAKLLKEKGFDEKCNNHYSQALFEGTNPDWEGVFPKYSVFKHSEYHYNSIPGNNDLWFECSAPTIVEVVMWLYEKHGIWVYVECDCVGKDWFPKFNSASKQVWEDDDKVYKLKSPLGWFNSPTEAYEAAINHTLNNLI